MFKLQILTLAFLIQNIFSFTGYFNCEISCANDYPDYLITSEGIIPPINPNPISHRYRDYYYIYNFTATKHDFSKQICLQLVNLRGVAGFSFTYASINEYDITFLNYENYYHCDNCNIEVPKRFQTTTTMCGNSPFISTGNVGNIFKTVNNTFCLNQNTNISNFFIDECKINQKFYKGKKVEYILNNETNYFNIDNIFNVNGYEDLPIYLDTVSLKIVNITNKKGNIFNGDEELIENSFFKPKNNYLKYIKTDEDGYLMTISIETKVIYKEHLSISTCEKPAEIYLHISQKNCSINEFSHDFCQKCIPDYGKFPIDNKCYHKSEKLKYYYYESSNQIWKPCETNGINFTCSVCPKGTFLKNSSSQVCEKCPEGEFSKNEDAEKCEKCSSGSYSNLLGAEECKECPEGYTSLPGSFECYKDCDIGYYAKEDSCLKCNPGFYSDKRSSLNCLECEENKYSSYGASKCSLCKEIIQYCDKCSKELICLECNNNAVSGFSNCTICENKIDWKYEGGFCQLTTICPKYFYKDKNNNNKINCIEDVEECPENMDYLNLVTKECQEEVNYGNLKEFQYKVKGGKDKANEISNNVLFEYKSFPEFFEDYVNRYKIKIKGYNTNIQIGSEENLKNPDDTDIGIDLGDCPDIIRTKFEMKHNNEIIYKVVDFTFNGRKYVDYYLYDTDDLETPLNLSSCENQNITIVSSPQEYLDSFENFEEYKNYFELLKDGKDIYDIFSPLYTDICYPLPILNKYDLTLADRRNYITKKNITICQNDCQYEGENLENFQIICYCKIKTDMENQTYMNFITDEVVNLVKYKSNFRVLKCYKLNFSLQGQKYNFYSYIFIFFFILNIILLITTEISLDNYLKNVINYCKSYIDEKNDNNENINNSQFKKLRQIYLNKNEKEGSQIIERLNRCIKEKILNCPPKHSIKNISPELKKKLKNFEQLKKIIYSKYIKPYFSKFKIINKNNDKSFYYVYLIYIYPKEERQNFLLESELNNLDYGYYRNIENRKWYEILWSLFKLKYDFINTFFIYNKKHHYKDFKKYPIKIMTYINSLMISIVINISFYTEETMHQIYEDDGNYNIIYRLPKICITELLMKLFSILFEKLIDFEEKLIKIKINMDISSTKEDINGNNNQNKSENIKENIKKDEDSKQKKDDKILNLNKIKSCLSNEVPLSEKKNILKKKHERSIKNTKKENIDKSSNNKINNYIDTTKNQKTTIIPINITTNGGIIKDKETKESAKDKQAIEVEKSFRRRRIIFYIIIIILSIFDWYYVSCFCSIYKVTQKHLLFDFIVDIPLNLISTLVICFVHLFIKIFIIKGKYSCIKKVICQIFKDDYKVLFIIEKIIEYLAINNIKNLFI